MVSVSCSGALGLRAASRLVFSSTITSSRGTGLPGTGPRLSLPLSLPRSLLLSLHARLLYNRNVFRSDSGASDSSSTRLRAEVPPFVALREGESATSSTILRGTEDAKP
eukprot:991086-Pyramimonas_sp.AAC.1